MESTFDTHSADKARLTFNQLPTEVQNVFLRQLPNLVASYASLYARSGLNGFLSATLRPIRSIASATRPRSHPIAC